MPSKGCKKAGTSPKSQISTAASDQNLKCMKWLQEQQKFEMEDLAVPEILSDDHESSVEGAHEDYFVS